MEFGPRALGSRSILADPRQQQMQSSLNLKIKYRESFRPFAPAVLEEKVNEWFDFNEKSPYMLLVAPINSKKINLIEEEKENSFNGFDKLKLNRSAIPAVTHVDYSARIQTVNNISNPKFYELIKKFDSKTGCPILINTSFNIRDEPIVCDTKDAFKCLMISQMDALVCGNFLIIRSEQFDEL